MYRQIDARFWTDPKIRELNLADRHTFLYLLTNPHTNMLGLYLLPLPYMADDLQQPLNTCRTAVERLSNANLIIYDQANRMMFVNHFLKYNTVAGNKREMGAVNKLQELPPTFLLANLLDAVIQYQPKLQLLTEALESVTKNDQRIPDQRTINGRSMDVELQEQEQEQIQEQDKEQDNNVSISYSEDFETFWAFWLSMSRGDNKLGAYDNWQTCLAGRNGKKAHDPILVTELLTAAKHYSEYCRAKGTSPEHVMLATTFLGPNQRWKDYVKKKKHINPDLAYAREVIEEAKKNG